MAYALVGSAGAANVTAVTTANTPAYGQSPTLNNLLVLAVAGLSGTNVATLPTTPSGWNLGPQTSQLGASTSSSITIYWKIAAGADAQPTITSKTNMVWNAQLFEFSGNATSTPNDQTGVNNATSGATLTATAGGTDSASGELVFGASSVRYSAAAAKTLTDTFNNGATTHQSDNGATATVAGHFCFSWGVTTGNSGADTYANAHTSTSITAVSLALISFKAASGATNFPLTVSPATYAITGSAVTPQTARKVSLSPASYAVTGSQITSLLARKLTAAPAAYAITGFATTMQVARKFIATATSMAISGSPTVMRKGKNLVANPAVMAITGSPILGRLGRVILAIPGAETITGFAATLVKATPGAKNPDFPFDQPNPSSGVSSLPGVAAFTNDPQLGEFE